MFIQVGIGLFVLMAFNVFVLDYGVMWIARAQAQNAADAGALAGAVARGFDDFDPDPHYRHSVAAQLATAVAQANDIWTEPGTPVVNFDCPAGVSGRCTTVAVYRNGEAGSTALDTLFGPILGVNSQGVQAKATAFTQSGNATPCLRPIAFADDWDEERSPGDEFNRYIETGPSAGTPFPPGDRDEYAPASSSYAGRTTVSVDFGERIVWEFGDFLTLPINRERLVTLDLPGSETFDQNMLNCVGQPIGLNQNLPVDATIHHRDVTRNIDTLFGRDSGADYDYGNHRITNSCAPACGPVSPRLIAVALYDPQRFQLGRALNPPNWTHPDVGCPTNQPCIRVTNIVGFFIHRIVDTGAFGPHGHFVRYPGKTVPTSPTYVDDGSWLVTTYLIR
jgi:hypothetical protein